MGIIFFLDEIGGKGVSLRGSRLVGGSKRMNKMKEYGVLIPCQGATE